MTVLEAPFRFPVETPGGFRTVLRFTAFRNIWFAQLAAQLADKFLLFSLIILAFKISGGSTPVAITLLTYTVPAVLLAPAEAAVIPTILPRSALITANSMALLTMVLTLVVGGALAPILSRIDLYTPY